MRPESQAVQPCAREPAVDQEATHANAPLSTSPSASESAGHAFITTGCTTRIGTDLLTAGWLDLIGDAEYVLENAATFDAIKQAIKKQQVSWLHVYLDADDATKKATQLARAHDRSRGLWLIEACGEWTAKSSQLRALSELDGVQSTRMDTRYHLSTHAAALPPAVGLLSGAESWLANRYTDYSALLSSLLSLPRHRLPLHELLITRDVERVTAVALQMKRQRAQADAKAIGGLRNPAASTDGDTKAHTTGDTVRNVILGILDGVDCKAILNTLGQQDMPTTVSDMAERARRGLEDAFGVKRSTTAGIQAELIAAIVQSAGDVDTEVVAWLTDSAPLGIDRPIVPKGVFPLAEPAAAATALDESELVTTGYANSASYDDDRAEADANLQEELVRGRILWRRTKAELHRMRGAVVYNKIGVIAKIKHQLLKIRLIHDLRRSGVNSKVVMHERVILPRLMDVVRDLLALQQEHGLGWDVFIADFKDAF